MTKTARRDATKGQENKLSTGDVVLSMARRRDWRFPA
jgi:hypothetical protein